MRKQRDVVLTLAILCHLYWTHALLTIFCLFARTAAEAMALLDDLVSKLQNIGLQLSAAKIVVLTSEIQPPSSLHSEQWNCVTGAETRAGTQMAWLHDQRCRIKEHTSGSPTSSSSCIKSFSCKQMDIV